MKVVALISGGKDSCYNMMHCVANGHQIVALANLKPQSKSKKGLSFNFHFIVFLSPFVLTK
jgi:diphthamide synthase (EF-2-diphthine--ammonia ligase)